MRVVGPACIPRLIFVWVGLGWPFEVCVCVFVCRAPRGQAYGHTCMFFVGLAGVSLATWCLVWSVLKHDLMGRVVIASTTPACFALGMYEIPVIPCCTFRLLTREVQEHGWIGGCCVPSELLSQKSVPGRWNKRGFCCCAVFESVHSSSKQKG